jgi:hypothetical protein
MSEDKKKKNWFIRHKVWTVIIVLVVLAIIGSAANGGKSDTQSVTPGTSTSPAPEEKTEYAVNEPATVDQRTVTVTNVHRNYSTGNPYLTPESGKEFVVVTVEITNNSQETLSYNTFDFKMQDSNGVQQSESLTALSDGKLNSGSLAPGGKVTGKLAYEVPSGDKGLKLLFQNPSLFSNKVITFKL